MAVRRPSLWVYHCSARTGTRVAIHGFVPDTTRGGTRGQWFMIDAATGEIRYTLEDTLGRTSGRSGCRVHKRFDHPILHPQRKAVRRRRREHPRHDRRNHRTTREHSARAREPNRGKCAGPGRTATLVGGVGRDTQGVEPSPAGASSSHDRWNTHLLSPTVGSRANAALVTVAGTVREENQTGVIVEVQDSAGKGVKSLKARVRDGEDRANFTLVPAASRRWPTGCLTRTVRPSTSPGFGPKVEPKDHPAITPRTDVTVWAVATGTELFFAEFPDPSRRGRRSLLTERAWQSVRGSRESTALPR